MSLDIRYNVSFTTILHVGNSIHAFPLVLAQLLFHFGSDGLRVCSHLENELCCDWSVGAVHLIKCKGCHPNSGVHKNAD